jgi:transposase-like protein
VSELTVPERGRLTELEAIVEAGLKTFVDVGLALSEIRDGRLYRDEHETFEAYLDERWAMSRQRGYQLIDGARVVEFVSTTVDTPPTNERQARELARLLDEPELMSEAWEEAIHVSDGNPTAAAVAEAVKRRRMTDEDRARIVALLAEGKKQNEVAEMVGFSQGAVSNVARAARGGKGRAQMPKRRQVATAQTLNLAKLHHAVREWDKLGDEEYIPAPELARRIRVLDQALTFMTRKRAHYYALTGRPE